MSKPGDPRSSQEWRKVRARVLRGATLCHAPGCLFPNELLRHDAPRGHPLKATVDHVYPVHLSRTWSDEERQAALFDIRWLRPAHFACNVSLHNHPEQMRDVDRRVGDWGV